MVSANFDHSSENGRGQPIGIPEVIPILPVRNLVVYPNMVVPITIGHPRSLRVIETASRENRTIGVVTIRNPNTKEPNPNDIYKTGTAANILRTIKAPDGTIHIMIQGTERFRIKEWLQIDPYMQARVQPAPEVYPPDRDLQSGALKNHLLKIFNQLVSLIPQMPDELKSTAKRTDDLRQLVYLVGSNVRMEIADAQEILELDRLDAKLNRLTSIISHELEVLELGKKIQSEARSEMDKSQREYFLRQQLKAIQKELGEENQQQVKLEEFRKKILESGMPEEVQKEALHELGRLERLPEASSEYGIIETYLDWMTALPWNITTEDIYDIPFAKKVLDEDHYNLEKVKERLLEFLAVRKLRKEREEERAEDEVSPHDAIRREREGVILCFVGPPGVGKTSLGRSIARALGRKFRRLSLGGIRDEAEIRGHRRTYIGAMPGRFIQALRRLGTKNPVIMLDEVDKIGSDWRGDPSSALLEVLDPEQNSEFRDNYLDAPFDLSKVMFIATANVMDTVPGPLRDRMEVIELSGYTDDDKYQIAGNYLIPRQIRENGLRLEEVELSKDSLYKIIREYTREPGVRGLERQIGKVCRKVATEVAKGKTEPTLVTADNLKDFLGKPTFSYEIAERTELPGVATGLAVTYAGGDILFVEATRMPGKKEIKITGQLGDVMKESVHAALSYVRAQAAQLNIDEEIFEKSDIHIHIPAGATPKDGPSAGVTLVTALTSLLTGATVRKEVGMTGEITLRGKVLPVGGIKEKVLAAHRAGLKIIILPKKNEKDLDDLPENVRESMEFVLVDAIHEVLSRALSEPPKA